MQIDIQARHFTLTEPLREHAKKRIHFAMSCCGEHIKRIVMRLSDINGPRGGKDKLCHLQVVLNGLPDVIVKDIQTNLYVAIDRAVDRAGRTVIRKIERQQDLFTQG